MNNEKKTNLQQFLDFVGDSYLITYDAIFNYCFLIKKLDFLGLKRINKNKIRCVHKIYEKFKLQKTYDEKNTFILCDHFKKFKTDDPFYDCLFGVTIIAQLFFQLYKKFIDETINQSIKKNTNENVNNIFFDNVLDIKKTLMKY